MIPDLRALLSSPCCPGCLRTATRIDRSPADSEDATVQPGDPLPLLIVWPDGTEYNEEGGPVIGGVGYWCLRCSCGYELDGDDPIPTVRSLTPAAVLALLEPTPVVQPTPEPHRDPVTLGGLLLAIVQAAPGWSMWLNSLDAMEAGDERDQLRRRALQTIADEEPGEAGRLARLALETL